MGRPARADEGHLREARHPRGRAEVPGRRHRTVRVPPGFHPSLDDERHARHQGARAGRRGVLPRRGDAPDRRRSRSWVGRLSGEKEIFELRAGVSHDRRLGQPPVPACCATSVGRAASAVATPHVGAGRGAARSATWSPWPPTCRPSGSPRLLDATPCPRAASGSPTSICAGSSGCTSAMATSTTAALTRRSRSPSTPATRVWSTRSSAVAAEQFGLSFRLATDGQRLTAPRHGRARRPPGAATASAARRLPSGSPPWVYRTAHSAQRLAFLAGFIDADGTVGLTAPPRTR